MNHEFCKEYPCEACKKLPYPDPSRSAYPPLKRDPAEGFTSFGTGAVRSADADNVAYHLISPVGLRRLAETYREGQKKYGEFQWEHGMPIGDILNHGIRHIYKYLEGDRTEDHLAHAAWNLLAAMHMEETHPQLNHQLRPEKKPNPVEGTPKDFTEAVSDVLRRVDGHIIGDRGSTLKAVKEFGTGPVEPTAQPPKFAWIDGASIQFGSGNKLEINAGKAPITRPAQAESTVGYNTQKFKIGDRVVQIFKEGEESIYKGKTGIVVDYNKPHTTYSVNYNNNSIHVVSADRLERVGNHPESPVQSSYMCADHTYYGKEPCPECKAIEHP